MDIFFNHDRNLDGKERIETYFSAQIKTDLSRFEDRLTRIEVHLSDQNGGKTAKNDKKCLLEARPQKLKPIAVTGTGDTIEQAINDATKKMTKSLSSLMGKLQAY